MAPKRRASFLRFLFPFLCGLLAVSLLGSFAPADEVKKPRRPARAGSDRHTPETVEDLRAIQGQVEKVLEKVMPSIVGVKIGPFQGSGVIVRKDGTVLTAGHVSSPAGQEVNLIFPGGKTVKGKTLGADAAMDSGMIKIVPEGDWPTVEMGQSDELKPGQWCIACGHPGGFKQGRSPVVRLGRILKNGSKLIVSDCTLVGGDSGGPLFDMHGRVIGIHSRISGSILVNVHVPVNAYRDHWDRLAKGEVWNDQLELFDLADDEPWLGVRGDPDAKDCTINHVLRGSPAEKGGLKPNDVVKKFDGHKVQNFTELTSLIHKKKPGDEVALVVQRGDETLRLRMVLGQREE